MVAEAIALGSGGPVEVEAVFVAAGAADGLDAQRVAGPAPLYRVADGVLDGVLDPVTPQPMAAIVARPTAVEIAASGTVLCLVEARDPGNVGTLLRSAEAAGLAGVVLAGPSVDPTNPKAVRASAGAVLRLPVAEFHDVDAALDALAAGGRTLVATVIGSKAIPYDDVQLVDAAVVLGNEAHGLPESVVARADVVATIPLAGPTESLNLAVAGSLFCFEALRQRRRSHRPNSMDIPHRTGQVGE